MVRACLIAAIWLPLFASAAPGESPAQRREAVALRIADARPDDREAQLRLASAWLERARESADASFYDRAATALAQAREGSALPVAEAGRIDVLEAFVALGRHDFAEAERMAARATRRRPQDPQAWAALGDARMELGHYAAAASSYQRMLDLRPGPAAWVRAAHYRELTGDLDGARRLLRDSLAATPQTEIEQRAWTLVQLAGVATLSGELADADALYREALDAFPGYPFALSGRARLALLRGDPAAAEPLARAALAAVGHPELRLPLADALRQLGREPEARAEEQRFEAEALANQARADNENLFLVDFYLDRRPDPKRALRLARLEASRRSDLRTRVRLARALHANGRGAEARALAERVLATGTRDPEILELAVQLAASGDAG